MAGAGAADIPHQVVAASAATSAGYKAGGVIVKQKKQLATENTEGTEGASGFSL